MSPHPPSIRRSRWLALLALVGLALPAASEEAPGEDTIWLRGSGSNVWIERGEARHDASRGLSGVAVLDRPQWGGDARVAGVGERDRPQVYLPRHAYTLHPDARGRDHAPYPVPVPVPLYGGYVSPGDCGPDLHPGVFGGSLYPRHRGHAHLGRRHFDFGRDLDHRHRFGRDFDHRHRFGRDFDRGHRFGRDFDRGHGFDRFHRHRGRGGWRR